MRVVLPRLVVLSLERRARSGVEVFGTSSASGNLRRLSLDRLGGDGGAFGFWRLRW